MHLYQCEFSATPRPPSLFPPLGPTVCHGLSAALTAPRDTSTAVDITHTRKSPVHVSVTIMCSKQCAVITTTTWYTRQLGNWTLKYQSSLALTWTQSPRHSVLIANNVHYSSSVRLQSKDTNLYMAVRPKPRCTRFIYLFTL